VFTPYNPEGICIGLTHASLEINAGYFPRRGYGRGKDFARRKKNSSAPSEQRQKIQFLLQNRLASPRSGRARRKIFQLAVKLYPLRESFSSGNRTEPPRHCLASLGNLAEKYPPHF